MSQPQKEQENILATGKIGRLLAQFALPSVVAMVAHSLYTIIDQIFIGQGVGYLGNGATNVVFLVTLITLSLSLLLGDGTAAYFSLRLGEGKKEAAAKGVGNTIVSLTALSLIVLAAGNLYLDPLLRAFGGTDALMPLAMDYGRIIVWGLPLIMVSTALNAVIRADGSPKFAMLSMMSGAILNVVLDPICIFVLRWGVEGAAIATVFGQLLSFSLTALYLVRMKCIRLTKDDLKFSFTTLGKISGLGVSSFIDQISFTLVLAVNNNLLVYYGAASAYGSEIPLTAFGIAMKVQQILFAIVLGIAVGMQPIVGYNYGAENYARVKRACLLALMTATAVSLVGAVAFISFPHPIIALFGSPEEALYFAFSEKFFRIYFLLVAFLGFQTVAGIFFQAIGMPLKASIISLSYQIIFRVMTAVLLAAQIGLDGVLWSGPAADLLAFLLALALIAWQFRQINALEAKRQCAERANKP